MLWAVTWKNESESEHESVSQILIWKTFMNVRMKKLHQETKNRESAIKDFIVTSVKTKTLYVNIA